jgi:penicillin amidase
MLRRLLRWRGEALALLALALGSPALLLWYRGWGPAAALAGVLLAAAAAAVLLRRGPFGERLISWWVHLRRTRPKGPGPARVPSLAAPVEIGLDRWGIPSIAAGSRLDAMRALGYVSSRDRLFQMDMLRREAAGTLAEVLGRDALEKDKRRRVLGLSRAARRIAATLPPAQTEVLQAYADGANALMAQTRRFPCEFRVLGYEPEPWAAEDSLLVLLQMFLLLCGDEQPKRMLAILESCLPPEVVAFLTPAADEYSTSALPCPLPVDALRALLQEPAASAAATELVRTESLAVASNCWAVSGSKTRDGRAILANDLHMRLAVPNLLYRASLRYAGRQVSGLVVPGLPLVLAGSNGSVCWGLANLCGDCLDLVQLDTDDEDQYRTPEGWRRFETRHEEVKVRGGHRHLKEVRTTLWGPVLDHSLLDQAVALRWTALQPGAVDLGLIEMDSATTIEESLDVVSRFGGPPLSVIVTDKQGRIGRTACGRIPVAGAAGWARRGADAGAAWEGYVPPDDLPRVVDPPSGVIVSANDEGAVHGSRFRLGRDFSNSVRARSISERLAAMDPISERTTFELQLDVSTPFYEFYRQLALQALERRQGPRSRELARARRALVDWDGQASPRSQGLALLVSFRDHLARNTLGPFLRRCRKADESFVYSWQKLDAPLRAMLTERIPELLPDASCGDWDGFILAQLAESVRQVKAATARGARANRSRIRHPLSRPGLRGVLDMPPAPLPGCMFSINAAAPDWGAVARTVVAAGHEAEGLLHIPCGQAGHPLSAHYDDQHVHWVRGSPLPFLPGDAMHTLRLVP